MSIQTKQMKTLTLGHVMAEQAGKHIGLHIIKSHTNIKYIQTVIILYLVNDRHYILEY